MIQYGFRVFIATSILINVLLGGNSNQTFSARNWEWQRNNKYNLVALIDYLLGKGHCSQCWSYWMVRRDKW